MEKENNKIKNLCDLHNTHICISNSKNDIYDVCDFIYENLHKMSDEEIHHTHNKLFNNVKKKKKELLFYELAHRNDKTNYEKTISRNEFIKQVNMILTRYQPCVDEYYEDTVWKFHNDKQTKYELDENCIIFDNSIPKIHDENDELELYIDLMTKKLKNINQNVKVRFCVLEDEEYKIMWHAIKCTFK